MIMKSCLAKNFENPPMAMFFIGTPVAMTSSNSIRIRGGVGILESISAMACKACLVPCGVVLLRMSPN
mgnify:CR=1 FL=1